MLVYLKLLLTAFFWGGTFVAGRALSGHVGPCSAAFLRFALASLCLVGLALKLESPLPRLSRMQWFAMVCLGLTGVFLYNIFFFRGLQLITAGRAALIIAINPIVISLCSAFLFKERLTWIKITGIFLSVTGAMWVISRGNLALILDSGIGWGEIMIFGCVASWVSFSLIGKAVLGGLSPLVSITYSSVIGTLGLLIPAAFEGVFSHLTAYAPSDWLAIAYLGILGTVVGFIWYYQGIKSIGPARAGLFINFVPVSALLLGFLILKEPVSTSLITGAVMVVTGVYLTNLRFPQPAPAASNRQSVAIRR